MTSVPTKSIAYDFSADPLSAQNKINSAQLQAILVDLYTQSNLTLAAAAKSIRDDNTLLDQLVVIRNLAPEVVALFGNFGGWQLKAAVACATTANIVLAGEQTIDGVLTAGSRVLVKNQTLPAQNGIYVSGAGAWTRATDANTAQLIGVAAVFVPAGASLSGTAWVCTTTASGIVLETTGLTFAQFAGAGGVLARGAGGTGNTNPALWPTSTRLMCRVVAGTNITLATPGATIDGIAMAGSDRVLLTGQAAPAQNGPWIWNSAATPMTRPADYPTTGVAEAYIDMLVPIREGDTGAGSAWRCTTAGAITIDTTGTAWVNAQSQNYAVDTIAALKALTVHYGTVTLRGYYAPGDGGGGTFRWNAADATADNGGTVIAPTVGTGRWNRIHENVIDVRWFGARGNAAAEDTTAIDAAATFAWSVAGTLWFGPGSFLYNGAGLSNARLCVVGSGRGKTVITLSAGVYFINSAIAWSSLEVRDITFNGGAGVIKHTWAAANVAEHYMVRDCTFTGYTRCAIYSLATDMPYWQVLRNQFSGFDDVNTIGFAHSGYADCILILGNSFLKNRVAVKLKRGGNNAHIEDNDFIRYVAYAGTPRIGVWVVPEPAQLNDGNGLVIRGCKFGNENINGADIHVCYADEGAGTDTGDKFPNLGADSVGYIDGHRISDCMVGSIYPAPPAFIYSTTPNVGGCSYGPLTLVGGVPLYFLQFRTVAEQDRVSAHNQFGPFLSAGAGTEPQSQFSISNAPGVGKVIDPLGLVFDGERELSYFGGLDPTGYVAGMPTLVRAFTTGGGASLANVADSLGGIDAVEATFPTPSGASLAYAYIAIAAITVGKPVWVEFDVKQGSSAPLNVVEVLIVHDAGGAIVERRQVVPTAGWRRIRFRWVPRASAANILCQFQAPTSSTGTKVQIGRVRVYAAYEPLNVDMATPGGGRVRTRAYNVQGVNVNAAASDVATITGLPAKYRVTKFTAYDGSISLTTATVDLRTAAAGGGTALVAAQALSGCTAQTKDPDLALAAICGTDYQTAPTLTIRNVTAQGAAATVSFQLEIIDLT